eukprot:11875494-Karenia_brevis.AAC.1
MLGSRPSPVLRTWLVCPPGRCHLPPYQGPNPPASRALLPGFGFGFVGQHLRCRGMFRVGS